jgi:ribonuclease HI
MREVWPLKEHIPNTGKEWLFQALDQASDQERLMMLMTFWRIWHVRNELVHQKAAPPVEASRRFLCSYVDSLLCIKQEPMLDPIKGKAIIPIGTAARSRKHKGVVKPRSHGVWSKPPQGWAKLNVDGAWATATHTGGTGMVLRDEEGNIIITGCRFLQSCGSPLEAEVLACMDGLTLALERTSKPIIMESDCLEAVSMINSESTNRSEVAALIDAAKHLCNPDRVVQVNHISRDLNGVSHTLAKLGCKDQLSMVWIRHGPDIIRQPCNQDGTPME